MENEIKILEAQRDTIAAAKPTTPHVPVAVALYNALIDRLKKHVADSKPAAPAPAAPTAPVAAAPAAPPK